MSKILTGTATIPNGAIRNLEIATSADIDTSKMAQRALAEYPIPLTDAKIWDSTTFAILTATAGSDDLQLTMGTFGTSSTVISTGDLKNNTSLTTRYCRFYKVSVPPNFDAGETITLRAHCDMTTVASAAATIDFSVYATNGNGGIGSDLVTTAAQSCNSTTDADYDFQLDTSGLTGGEELDIRMALAINDTATGTTVDIKVGKLSLLCDTRG